MTEFNPQQKDAVIKDAVKAQFHAADPGQSVWVSANAGTGKTRVLTNRILRLLINGAAVTDILAVTYTKAAAAEMRNRLFARLARWAVIAETALTEDIQAMGIDRPSQDQIKRSRQLFAHLLDQPTGVRIETVHSFAQSVLRRFPLEAGVQPYFDLATNDQIRVMKTQAQAQILTSADPLILRSLLSLGQHVAETQMIELTSQMAAFPEVLAMARSNPVGLKTTLFQALGCDAAAAADPEAAKINMIKTAVAAAPTASLRAMVAACHQGNKTETEISKGIADWLALDDEAKQQAFSGYVSALLTKEGTPRKNFPSAKTNKSHPLLQDEFLDEAQRLQAIQEQLNAIDVAMLTFDLYVVSAAMASGYQRRKTDAGLMDFDDLINQTIHLLQQDGGASWVRYKLDRGLKYLLIDEAQDTSPSQWRILSSIAEEFFNESSEDQGQSPDRSLFSVGDFKQSIYSFQGARPELFKQQQVHFKNLSAKVRRPFAEVPLNTSFRTTAPILTLVDAVAGLDDGLEGLGEAPQHPVARVGDGGFVEILDPILTDQDDGVLLEAFTPAPAAVDASPSPEQALAEKIAGILKSWIGHRYLPAKGRVMRAGDVMILLKKRDRFGVLLDREIRLAGLPLAGADRVKLLDHIAVMDLIALGQVMVLPEDDLTLAAVLKSPLLGLDEDQLFALANDRGEASLMQRLAQFASQNEDPIYQHAHSTLTSWLGLAETLTPYEFYHDVLTTDQRLAFMRRLGAPVVDILAEFLNIARDFETLNPPSLQLFLSMIKNSDLEVTRDANAKESDEIRIMTIHGSKGLESPVVVLPDMLLPSLKANDLVTITDDITGGRTGVMTGRGMDLPVKPVAAAFSPQAKVVTAAKTIAKAKAKEEDNRLLYVALTRAEEGLLIAGFEAPRKRSMDGSWYQACRTALEQIDGVTPRDGGDGLQLTTAQDAPLSPSLDGQQGQTDNAAVDAAALENLPPSWLHHMAPPEETPPRPLSPSRYRISDKGHSPSGKSRQLAILKGSITHRLLEILPALDASERDRAAARIFAPHSPGLIDDALKQAILQEVHSLMADPDLAMIFDDQARVEVPISGRLGQHIVSGVIDRLLITADQVMIIDFKTGQPPKDGEDMPSDYLYQLAIYGHVLAEIYPQHDIKAGLVYTENASLHWADQHAMDGVVDRVLSTTS